MKRLAKTWILLLLAYAAGRLVVGYCAAGYVPLSSQSLAEILIVPAFQAIWLVSLVQALDAPGLLRFTARVFERRPSLGVWLLLDCLMLAIALIVGAYQWLRLASPAELIYAYYGLRFLALAGSAWHTGGASPSLRAASGSIGFVYLGLAVAPRVSPAVSSAVMLAILAVVLATLLVVWLGRPNEEGVFKAGLMVFFLPVVLIQTYAAVGPAPELYPAVWSSLRVGFGFLTLQTMTVAIKRGNAPAR